MTPEQFDEAASRWTSREADARRMPEPALRQRVDAFLSSHNTCALACGSGDFVRCTPLEYAWRNDAIWIFSEGGLKFRALKENSNVSLAIYEPYGGFGKLSSAQVTGVAQVVDPSSGEYDEAAAARGIKGPALEKVRSLLNLIKIVPSRIDLLDSSLKAEGYDSRQWVEW